ncbi:hypothetical protein N7465_009630 [Penicillium sp. CMV-2018d]|nr:hypothetical protein N7465_009630 [Penicillium sp. CMV-2018d]
MPNTKITIPRPMTREKNKKETSRGRA